MSLRKKFFRGISWVALLRGSTRLLAIAKLAIIARILTPEQVGLYGIAFLIISLLEVFTETGVNVFLIQEKKKLEEYVSTAWIVSIARGILISALILLLTPYIVDFFNTDDLYELLILIAFVPLLRGFINPSLVKFQKDMDFKNDFKFRFVVFMLDAIVAVIATLLLNSPAGLIIGLLAGVMLEILLSFIYLKPRPKFDFDWDKAKQIIKRGKWLTGTGIFQYLFREGDDVFVGKFLGEAPLGIYQYAYKIATLPISEVADVFGKVALPLFVGISENRKHLKQIYIKSTIAITILVLPFAALLFVFSHEVVYLLLGNQWLAAAPVLRVLVIYSVIRASLEPAMRVFLAIKKQEYTTTITLTSLVMMAILIFPLSQLYGLVGVGITTIIASIVSLPITLYFISRVFRNA